VIETARLSNQIIIGVNRNVGDGYANLLDAYERLEHPALRRTLEPGVYSNAPVYGNLRAFHPMIAHRLSVWSIS